jgi:hypothetical protein
MEAWFSVSSMEYQRYSQESSVLKCSLFMYNVSPCLCVIFTLVLLQCTIALIQKPVVVRDTCGRRASCTLTEGCVVSCLQGLSIIRLKVEFAQISACVSSGICRSQSPISTLRTKSFADDAFGCFDTTASSVTTRVGSDVSPVMWHGVRHARVLTVGLMHRGQTAVSLVLLVQRLGSGRSGLCRSARSLSKSNETVRVRCGANAVSVGIHVLALAHLVIGIAFTGPGGAATKTTGGRGRTDCASFTVQGRVSLVVKVASGNR